MPTVAAMSIRERLRLVFRGADVEAPTTDDPAVPSAPTTELEVVAYAEDCRLFGHLALSAARLTDMLNEADEIELVDVAVEALADGRIVEMRSMVVRRDELLVVQATGPRGARERRQRTRPHPVAVKTGPYLVRGLLHALPTADPFVALRRRPPMVPLTDGSISYTVAGSTVVRRADTIIVNRAVIDWVTPGTDDEVAGPELPALPAAKGILLKDFTGEIHPMPHDDVVAATPIAVAADVEARSVDRDGCGADARRRADRGSGDGRRAGEEPPRPSLPQGTSTGGLTLGRPRRRSRSSGR